MNSNKETAAPHSKKQALLDQIEIKDHYIDENGNKVHYSWAEMNLFVRAKYAYFCYEDESEFASLDEDVLENIERNLRFIKRKIPEWRKENPVTPGLYHPESPYMQLPPFARRSALLERVGMKDHFIDESGRKQYYSRGEMNSLLRSKYHYFNGMNEFDFSLLDMWSLWDIVLSLEATQANIIRWRKNPPNSPSEPRFINAH